MILDGGEGMVEAITIMFNQITMGNKRPINWKVMKILSLYKNKGSRQELKNRRDSLITSAISKLFELTMKGKKRYDDNGGGTVWGKKRSVNQKQLNDNNGCIARKQEN